MTLLNQIILTLIISLASPYYLLSVSSFLTASFLNTQHQTSSNIRAKLAGKVFDTENRPAFQSEIRIVNADEVKNNPDTVFAQNRNFAYIDQNGNYQLQWIPPGQYILAVNADFRFPYLVTYYPNTQSLDQAKVITIEGAEQLDGYDIQLPLPTLKHRVVKGTVFWADGRVAPGAEVNLLVAKYPWIIPSSLVADSEGNFSVTGFEGVEYLLHAWGQEGSDQMHAEPIVLDLKDKTEEIRLVLSLPGKGLPIKDRK